MSRPSSCVDVSIIIPSYNSEPFLKRSVLSCLTQTGISLEVILVDDEGKDFTRDILEAIQRDNPDAPLKTIYRPGGMGQATARNEGLKAAQGRYIALLDSDDAFCANDVLARWVAEADAADLDMSVARFYNVSPAMARRQSRRINLAPGEIHSVASAPELVNVVSCWQILYRRSFLEENEVIFSPRLKQREDRLFVIEAFLKAQKIATSNLFVVDHFNVANSSFKQIDAGQLQQYVQHLTELNAAFAAARKQDRSSTVFERANAIIYLRQLDEYWAGICRRLSRYPRHRALVEHYFAALRTMVEDLPKLYDDTVLDTGAQDGFLREARMDILRLALKNGDNDLLVDLLRQPKLPLDRMAELRHVDDSSEEILTRVWSFRRKAPGQAGAEAPAPLQDLVKKVILHTGLPKTGTSTLQQVLERNRFALMEAGVHYPLFGTNREFSIRRDRTPGHAVLVHSILNDEENLQQGLAAEVQQAARIAGRPIDTLVLSAENIVSPRFWTNGAEFAKLAAFFEGIELEVVCVLRHPESWLSSLYVEMCGNPWNQFSNTLSDLAADLDARGLFDGQAITDTLQAPEQVSQLHIGCFETIRQTGGIEPWFFEIMGISNAGFAPVPASLTNQSQTPLQAAVLRGLKRTKGLDREALTTAFQNVDTDAELAADKGLTRQMAAGLKQFRQSHAAQIAAYEARFGTTSGGERPVSPADMEQLLDHQLAALQLTPEPELVAKTTTDFLQGLDKAYRKSNHDRILFITREDRGLCVGATLQPDEVATDLKIIASSGALPQPLLQWEGQALTLVDPSLLAQLWADGEREIELELPTNQRVGRRPFRIIQLKIDNSYWLVPPKFMEFLQGNALKNRWE
ncbi:glycosyltransferase family 2 protein [Tritonibacter aquimaris]|nr:glycosyltransferase family 2 protein [Tritonibacter aquimaris]